MQRIRLAVRENRLTSALIGEIDYLAAIEETGRDWVAESGREIVGFAVANAVTGDICDSRYELAGIGPR